MDHDANVNPAGYASTDTTGHSRVEARCYANTVVRGYASANATRRCFGHHGYDAEPDGHASNDTSGLLRR